MCVYIRVAWSFSLTSWAVQSVIFRSFPLSFTVKWPRAVACLTDQPSNPSSPYLEAYGCFHLRHFCVVGSARLFCIYHSKVKTKQKPTHNTMAAEYNTQAHQSMPGCAIRILGFEQTSAGLQGSPTARKPGERATLAFVIIS